jgi:hypothetical protein
MVGWLIGRILIEAVCIWLFTRAARQQLSPEKQRDSWQQRYGDILPRMFGVQTSESSPPKGSRALGYISLAFAFLVWVFFVIDVGILLVTLFRMFVS